MFDEPNEEPVEGAASASDRAREKSDELRMHAELAAVFEGVRKFDAQLIPGLDAETARQIQQTVGRLEKSKKPDSPVLPADSAWDAGQLLAMPTLGDLSTNDYHIHRRPGEVMIVRWLEREGVDTFYTRIQAHFDAALEGLREDERQAHAWKQEPEIQEYLAALDDIKLKMVDVYLRPMIDKYKVFVLSTQAADEINIAFLADHIMSVPAADIVGRQSAPPDEPQDSDLAWFFKLFSLRGIVDGVERMCFFAFLQKTDDAFDW